MSKRNDLDEAREVALAMVDIMPLWGLRDLHAEMEALDAKYKREGIDVPPGNVTLKEKVESRIKALQVTA